MTPAPLRAPVLWLPALFAAGCEVVTGWPGADEPIEVPGASDAGALSGTVVDEAGTPVAGAYVTTEPGGVEAVTDSAGAWRIARLPPGEYRVVAAAAGRVAATSDAVTVSDGAEATLALALAEAPATSGTLTVTVLGPGEVPLEGIAVIVDLGGQVTLWTDAAGVAETTGIAASTLSMVVEDPSARWWPRTLGAVAFPAGGNLELEVTLAGRAEEGSAYASSSQCVMCHDDVGAQWSTTAHAAAMTEVVGAPAEGFVAGEVVDLGGPTATLAWESGEPVVRLVDVDGAEDTWPVSGFIGGEARGAVPWAERDGRAFPLPVAWIPSATRRAGFEPGGWTEGDLEPWFDAAGRFLYASTPAASASAEAACFGCHATGTALSEVAGVVSMVAATRSGARWDEAAVGCEACHGPGVDHSSGPRDGMADRITNPADLAPDEANDVCGQCHAALAGAEGTPYAWSATHERFRPGMRMEDVVGSAFDDWGNGTAAAPGAMVDELRASAHGSSGWDARCTDCHDPHGSALTADLVLEPDDNTLCASCHEPLTFAGDAEAMAEHTQHAYLPTSPTESGRCTGCHMPGTAARLRWSDQTAAGDLSSHRFVTVPPSFTLASFDAAGADTLPPGAFAPNGCQECHAWNDAYFGGGFPGPAGDFTTRAAHEALSTAFAEKYP